MEPDTSTGLQSVSLPADKAPAKPARSAAKQADKNKAYSVGASLTSNANFYDIPVSDAFNDLLERYIPIQERPQRDAGLTSEQLKSPEVMVLNNMWRAVAKLARQQIVHADPNNVVEILKLWYMRLLALTKLGLNQLASAEFEKLGDLNRAQLKDEETGESLVPYELWILWGRLPFFLKFPSITLERLTMLAVHCKKMQKRNSKSIWEKREIQTYLILATHWIAIKEYSPAASTMKYILEKVPDDIDIVSSLGRLYLQMGDLDAASAMFSKMDAYKEKDGVQEAIQINKGFECIAKGEWEQAKVILEKVYQSNNENLLVLSNLAVCQVYLGQLAKAIEILETLTLQNPTTAGTCETALNNLCTLYELRYEDPTEKKIEIVKQVARWTGDSFQPECLKL